jgi:hypothetical protein
MLLSTSIRTMPANRRALRSRVTCRTMSPWEERFVVVYYFAGVVVRVSPARYPKEGVPEALVPGEQAVEIRGDDVLQGNESRAPRDAAPTGPVRRDLQADEVHAPPGGVLDLLWPG